MAQLDGRTVFVEGAFPGEQLVAEIDDSQKILRGRLIELTRKSPERRVAPCDIADQCGGCDWLALTETAQTRAKEEIVVSTLEHLGGIARSEYELRKTLSSPRSTGYRRRAVMHLAHTELPRLAFFGRRSHERIAVDRCPALASSLSELPKTLAPSLAPLGNDVDTVTLLSEGDVVAFAVQLTVPIRPKHEQAVGKALHESGAKGAVLLPKEGSAKLFGKPVLRALSPLHPETPLFLRPDGFAQANAEANVGLVTAAVYELGATEKDRVLELYSGNGNFTFAIAGTAKDVVAIESSPVGVELAQRSVREGAVKNVRLMLGDALKLARSLADEGQRFDLLLADPPRTGAMGLAEIARRLSVRRVVYVACDPAALARDASDLKEAGFRPRALQLVDMFPQTHHIEAVMAFDAKP